MGTSGDHRILGRLIHREASLSDLDEAAWIRQEYQSRLPMQEANILDYYHFQEHVLLAAKKLYGVGMSEVKAWELAMCSVVCEEGPVERLGQIRDLKRVMRSPVKREALSQLETYLFRGWQCGVIRNSEPWGMRLARGRWSRSARPWQVVLRQRSMRG